MSRPAFLASARALSIGFAACFLLMGAWGCRSPLALRVQPVNPAASLALEEARLWMRRTTSEARARARAAVERARRLQPDWVAPRRLLDEFSNADLLGVEALAGHRASLSRDPDDAATHYLTGRLEGEQGAARFQRAVALDDEFAWGYHGLAWVAARGGDIPLALRYERLALERARDGWERSYFTAALSRFYAIADQPKKAIDVLLKRIDDPETGPIDLIELSVQAAQLELTMIFQPEARQGTERALELLRDNELTEEEVEQLVRRLQIYPTGDGGGSLELLLALASRSTPARDRLRAELMLEERPTPLALGLLRRSRTDEGRRPPSGPLMRAARFAAGQFQVGVEEWLSDLPQLLIDAEGLPLDPGLRAVVQDARALQPGSAHALVRFGDSLLAAGWFREARSVASVLASDDLDRALALEERATAGRALLVSLRRLFENTGELARRMGGDPAPARSQDLVRDLKGLLDGLAPAVARAHALLGGETEVEAVARLLAASPLHRYGMFGVLIHPGPRFSAADQAAGRGRAGEPVPGLAEELARIGRFGVVGEMLGGGGPDGAVLRRLLIEERSGEHLDVSWSGTVAWCEGADVESRASRLGASISGAALHEGYWIDIDAVRRERDQWAAFARRFDRDVGFERSERALASRGLALRTPARDPDRRRRERRSIDALLGQSDRLRLAVLRDRARSGQPFVDLDELVKITALHEEGHLCDRARFLPLARNIGRVTGFLLSTGPMPRSITRRLEYRAQLVALCAAPDPRLVWVDVLRAGENASDGPLTHAAAYHDLLRDLVVVLDRELEHHPEDWREIDPDFVLVHQVHWLGPEKLRKLGRILAKREGLDGL
jgi:hypothetical protein